MASFDLSTHIKSLLELEFYALCPNGKRIRVQDLCREGEGSTEGYAYRTFDDRLVLVIEAVFPEEKIYNGTLSVMVNYIPERVYWRQAFYLSTGESSGKENTWLPFSGIFVRFHHSLKLQREIFKRNKYGRAIDGWNPYAKNSEAEGEQIGQPWFAKHEYIAPEYGASETAMFEVPHQHMSSTNQRKMERITELYGKLYLPEGNFIQTHYSGSFSRFGCPSYALASHALGGMFFDPRYNPVPFEKSGDILFRSFQALLRYQPAYGKIKDKLNTPSRFQTCFAKWNETYAIQKPYVVNNYIDKLKAIPIMNAFRDLNVFPPGFSLIQMPIHTLGYSLPIVDYYGMLQEGVHYYWMEYKLGRIPPEEIQRIFQNPSQLIQTLMKRYRKIRVLGNEPTISFGVREPSNKQQKYYGGTRRHSKQKRFTRKSNVKSD
jgi:hypothetical protein